MTEQQDKEASDEGGGETRRFSRLRTVASSPPFVLTAIVALAVLASFVVLIPWPNNGPTLMGIFHVSCSLSLAVLAAILSAIQRGWKIYLATFFLLLFDGFALVTVTSGPRVELLIVLLPLLIATPILITLESIKFCLGTFTNSKLPGQPFDEGLQFKTKHLFIVTAVLAIVIATAQSLAPYFSTGNKRVYFIVAAIVVLLSVNALVSVWAILGRKVGVRFVISLITAVLLLVVAIQVLNYSGRTVSGNNLNFWISFSTLSWMSSSLQLYLFRRLGYRFVRHAK